LWVMTHCAIVTGYRLKPRPFYPQGNSLRYPLDMRLRGHQSPSGHCGEERNVYPYRESNPDIPPSRYLIYYSAKQFSIVLSRISAVGVATGYGLDDQGVGVRVPVGARIFTSPRRPHRLWGPPNFLSNWYRRLFPRG
jgi:hypothetical protein